MKDLAHIVLVENVLVDMKGGGFTYSFSFRSSPNDKLNLRPLSYFGVGRMDEYYEDVLWALKLRHRIRNQWAYCATICACK